MHTRPRRDERRFLEVHRRLSRTARVGAMAITVAIGAFEIDRLDHFLAFLALHLIVFPMNMLVFDRAVPKIGPRGEIERALFNSSVSALGYQLLDWPLPVWFWLVFTAVDCAQFGNRTSLIVLIITCTIMDTAALVNGVPVFYPASFTLLAFVVRHLSAVKLDIIREMLAESERQRQALDRGHQALKVEAAARERAVGELRQAQKLEAIGRLASGVAHEINTPMQFIGDNLRFVTEGVTDLLAVATKAPPADAAAADLPYLRDNLPAALANAAEGVTRVAAIVRSMRQFAHAGDVTVSLVDLNTTIRSTLTIAANEYRFVADAVTDLGELPLVECCGSEVGQVLLNLIVNAAHAIEDRVHTDGGRGRITVRSRAAGDHVVIAVEDTGAGIPESIQHRIFDPFFSTKDVDRGSGQGLAISSAVMKRHGGALTFDSTVGVGTTFYIKLPVATARLQAA